MAKMYTVQGTVTKRVQGWRTTRQIPTFFLAAGVQGITSAAHADTIAREVINPMGEDVDINILVTEVDSLPQS